ncbi:helix-turn-helix transcriptional regulator [Actinomadura decatromicini]|uniref:Helix-turn-helix transcriptional regulator n=1 Tax=Actinomadura decatromicini TaxID=2604572 RepID=A0A5D3FXQ7_9ACTN|nr:helix-turn-helix transcriptional regulator [Actinomadura decatromicini]TYK52812.1 helix-turn-helix transcriptional regulator [Actinomadura decatromicini]
MSARSGPLIRSARIALGWSQADLADRLHCSRSTVSRIETGSRLLDDVATLRRLADVLEIPPELFGVTATVTGESPGEDDVRRRELLATLAVTAGATVTGPALRSAGPGGTNGQGALLVTRLRDVLLGTGARAEPIPPSKLAAALAAACRDYDACDYGRLAEGLPRLLAGGHAAAGDAGAATVLAQTYNLITRLMIKLDESLGWLAGDRARTFAELSGDVLAAAEAARQLAVLARRNDWFDQATGLAMAAADDDGLQDDRPAHVAARGQLVMSAAYTAAHAGDRGGMRELTGQAMSIAARLGGGTFLRQNGGGFGVTAVRLHLISAEYAAGDPAMAVQAARAVRPQALPTAERRARYFTDVARAYGMWGRRDETLRALLIAERIAPQETRTRPAVRELVSGLLATGRTSPDLRGLAARCRLG